MATTNSLPYYVLGCGVFLKFDLIHPFVHNQHTYSFICICAGYSDCPSVSGVIVFKDGIASTTFKSLKETLLYCEVTRLGLPISDMY